jgi:hypothetical protein
MIIDITKHLADRPESDEALMITCSLQGARILTIFRRCHLTGWAGLHPQSPARDQAAKSV